MAKSERLSLNSKQQFFHATGFRKGQRSQATIL